ncbi:MAG TPA: diacylglycerol kinase family protein [Mycobacteriales bacterium]|nr:diacylglycerol kinase family protein [Mycobacteriales bacterium]
MQEEPAKVGHRRLLARLAALAALVLLVLAVVPFLVLAVNIPAAIGVLACAAVAAYGVWLVVTRRRRARWLAVPVVLLALTGLGWTAYGHRVELVAFAGCLVLFGLAARAAVRTSRTATGVRPVPPAQRAVLFVNPRSGDGKADRVGLVEEATRRGITTVVLAPGDDLRAVVEQAIDAGADVVGMAGGDGSQGIVAAVASERGVAHVCIPSGTRNHFALDLGLDRDDPVGALDAFTAGVERWIDLAAVNGRVFVNNASLGLYASVVQSAAYRNAKLGTWQRLLPDLVGPDAAPADLRYDAPDGSPAPGAALVLVSNNPYELRRLRVAGTRPRLDAGRLGILSATATGLGRLPLARRLRPVRQWSATEFVIDSAQPLVALGLDGEAVRMAPPLRFTSRPGALRVRLPASAPGVSPAGAAVGLSRRDLERLIRIAAGR